MFDDVVNYLEVRLNWQTLLSHRVALNSVDIKDVGDVMTGISGSHLLIRLFNLGLSFSHQWNTFKDIRLLLEEFHLGCIVN